MKTLTPIYCSLSRIYPQLADPRFCCRPSLRSPACLCANALVRAALPPPRMALGYFLTYHQTTKHLSAWTISPTVYRRPAIYNTISICALPHTSMTYRGSTDTSKIFWSRTIHFENTDARANIHKLRINSGLETNKQVHKRLDILPYMGIRLWSFPQIE